jgi:PAS domain S-box-containing protein
MATATLPFVEDEALRWQQLFEEAPVAYHEIDANGILRRVNHAECVLLGLNRDELIGRPVWDMVAPGDRSLARLAVMEKMARIRPLEVFQKTYCRNDGEVLQLELHEKLILDEDGRVIGIRTAMFDISRRLHAEQQLRNSHRWLVATLRSIPVGVIAVDAMATITLMNPAAESLTGWRQADVIGKDLGKVLHLLEPGKNCSSPPIQRVILNSSLGNPSGRYRLCDRSLRQRLVDIQFLPIRGDEEVILGVSIIMREIDPMAQLPESEE